MEWFTIKHYKHRALVYFVGTLFTRTLLLRSSFADTVVEAGFSTFVYVFGVETLLNFISDDLPQWLPLFSVVYATAYVLHVSQ